MFKDRGLLFERMTTWGKCGQHEAKIRCIFSVKREEWPRSKACEDWLRKLWRVHFLPKASSFLILNSPKARFCLAFMIFKKSGCFLNQKSKVRWKSQNFKICFLQKIQYGNPGNTQCIKARGDPTVNHLYSTRTKEKRRWIKFLLKRNAIARNARNENAKNLVVRVKTLYSLSLCDCYKLFYEAANF